MHIDEIIQKAFVKSLESLKKQGYKFNAADIKLALPRTGADVNQFGDWSTPLALEVNMKKGSKKIEPFAAGELLIENLPKVKQVKGWRLVRPGFINIFLSDEYYGAELKTILKEGDNYGSSGKGRGQKIQVEYVSANPTGPLHIGNSRGGFIGSALANVLSKAGYQTTREYYFNDDPYNNTQMQLLGRSILAELGLFEELNERYRGEYISEIADKVIRQEPKLKETKDVFIAGQLAGELVMEREIKPVLIRAGFEFDEFFHEGSLFANGKVQEAIEALQKKELVYEKDHALWFKATKFGDSQDWVVRKSTGEYNYLASDIAYHLNKFEERKFDKSIVIVGADTHAHTAKVKAAMKAYGYEDRLSYIITQIVRLIEKGKEVKMSKRAGTYVTLGELLEKVGKDVTRFFYLMHAPETHMDFDMDLARETSEKNPVYYVQYAHARIAGILREAPTLQGPAPQTRDDTFSLLVTPEERDLLRKLSYLPIYIDRISSNFQVHQLTTYAREVASLFHAFYDRHRVIQDDKPLMEARLDLVRATRIVLKNTLDLLGVSAPDRM